MSAMRCLCQARWASLAWVLVLSLVAGCASTPQFKLPAEDQATVEKALQALALELARQPLTPEEVPARLQAFLTSQPLIFGSTLAFPPSQGGGRQQYTAPYVYRQGTALASKELYAADYLYYEMPWYRDPATSGQASWSKPYFDHGGGEIWMATYSIPIYTPDRDRRLLGVLTADLPLRP